MKAKRIVLYPEQIEACKEYLETADKQANKNRPGAVIAQIVRLNDGSGVMIVNFANNELMKAVAAAQGRDPEILT